MPSDEAVRSNSAARNAAGQAVIADQFAARAKPQDFAAGRTRKIDGCKFAPAQNEAMRHTIRTHIGSGNVTALIDCIDRR